MKSFDKKKILNGLAVKAQPICLLSKYIKYKFVFTNILHTVEPISNVVSQDTEFVC